MKRIYDYRSVIPKILVCSRCKEPVEQHHYSFYSCKKCNSWTSNVEWKDSDEIKTS